MSNRSLLELPPNELLKLKLGAVGRSLTQPEIVAIFEAANASFHHPGVEYPQVPHLQYASGRHGGDYFDCPMVLRWTNLCVIMAQQMVSLLRQQYNGRVDWVLGSASSATGLAWAIAYLLGARWHPLSQKPDKSQVFEKMEIAEGEPVLHIEELMTTSGTAVRLREGVRIGNPNPVTFIPFVPVLIHRPAPGESCLEVEDSRVLPVTHFEIESFPPDNCKFCQAGSQLVSGKQNWLGLKALAKNAV